MKKSSEIALEKCKPIITAIKAPHLIKILQMDL